MKAFQIFCFWGLSMQGCGRLDRTGILWDEIVLQEFHVVSNAKVEHSQY
jgi:hypothetical protein